MKVEQFPYMSKEASELRRRDGIPPWGCHVCELDSLGDVANNGAAFYGEWLAAKALRAELEAEA